MGHRPRDRDGNEIKRPTLEDFHSALVAELGNERFLIVLDDVWSEEKKEWDNLWKPLTKGASGWKVIVTTRSSSIPKIINREAADPLRELSGEDSWLLFQKYAFASGSSENLREELGREVATKLKGVPLAIKVIGRSLCNAPIKIWNDALRQIESWSLIHTESEILPILKLSYQELTADIQQCFLFCSLFPKNHKFIKIDLVRMWMALDFVRVQRGRRLEDIGCDYLDELVDKFFFEKVGDDYVMHDLIHDLAQSIAGTEFATVTDKYGNNIESHCMARHISYFGYDSSKDECQKKLKQVIGKLYSFKKSRTFMCTMNSSHDHNCIQQKKLDGLFNHLVGIRLLVLHGAQIEKLPKSIGHLKHLRYLDVTGTRLKQLPKSICKLYNLQTLRFDVGCSLPKGMSKLINLRHLEGNPWSISKIGGMGSLSSLLDLNAFCVNRENGNSISELKDKKHLRRLHIWNLEKVKNREEASEASIQDMRDLDELGLVWLRRISLKRGIIKSLVGCYRQEIQKVGIAEEVFERLQPHSELKHLIVENYKGSKLPTWLATTTLSHLVSISLKQCSKLTILPPFGQLRRLKKLKLIELTDLTRVNCDFYGITEPDPFPSLETFIFRDMGVMEWDVPNNRVPFPSLKKLKISNCPNLTELPFDLPSCLSELKIVNVGLYVLPTFCTKGSSRPSLSTLIVRDCEELKSLLPLLQNDLERLETIHVFDCKDLDSFRLENFSPSALVTIWTDNRRLLSSLLPLKLDSLRELTIRFCKELTSFSEEEERGWQNLTSLRFLEFSFCGNLASLPRNLHCLRNLDKLFIYKCPNIERLPEEGLPPSLSTLWIGSCPKVKASCKGSKAPDRGKIPTNCKVFYL